MTGVHQNRLANTNTVVLHFLANTSHIGICLLMNVVNEDSYSLNNIVSSVKIIHADMVQTLGEDAASCFQLYQINIPSVEICF